MALAPFCSVHFRSYFGYKEGAQNGRSECRDNRTHRLCFFPLQIPRYFNEDQVVDFLSGLEVMQVKDYILLYESDAIALNYGYFPNLRNEFSSRPVYILFVGVGFIESQAFVIRYTKVGFQCMLLPAGRIRNAQLRAHQQSFLLDGGRLDLQAWHGPLQADLRGRRSQFSDLFADLLQHAEQRAAREEAVFVAGFARGSSVHL